MIRVTAYVLRAAKILKDKENHSPLSTEELSQAERKWSQRDMEHDSSFKSLKFQLNLFLDDAGLWRCGGRLANADIPYATKFPLLLSRRHHLTVLIVNDAHKRVLHNGVRETLTDDFG